MASDKKLWTRELLEAPHTVADKSARVRRMFDQIAPRYELVNRLFSGGRDAAWRRQAVRRARIRPDDVVLDIACGTGDLARAFARAHPKRVVGCDFSAGMLERARARPVPNVSWCLADAQHLPFRSGSFTVVSCAFGIRNFTDLDGAFSEMRRVLAPGGQVSILEFTRPVNRLARRIYEFYAHRIMPRAAALISRDTSGAYQYLPKSVVTFGDRREVVHRLKRSGFTEVTATPLTLGVVALYRGTRP